ncbi:MAG: YlbF family regulator [Spirochaetaceae bacterium]|nr:MAG: YlbF family regulator [Spirochaetaceae bacterium]
MEKLIQDATEAYIKGLKGTSQYEEYLVAQSHYSSNQELVDLRTQYADLVEQIQRKQAAEEEFHEDVDKVREIQRQVGQHPVTLEVIRSQKILQSLLRDCNQQMTSVLGIDFAGIAAPRHECGGCGGC